MGESSGDEGDLPREVDFSLNEALTRSPKVSAKWYPLNKSMDRDKDKIASER